MACSSEDVNENSFSIKGGNISDHMSNYQLQDQLSTVD
jgi:hypothetical protein